MLWGYQQPKTLSDVHRMECLFKYFSVIVKHVVFDKKYTVMEKNLFTAGGPRLGILECFHFFILRHVFQLKEK